MHATTDLVQEIWSTYRESGDTRQRDQLVFMLTPIVRHVLDDDIGEPPHDLEAEQRIGDGLAALVDAIERYEPATDVTLAEFALTHVSRAVNDPPEAVATPGYRSMAVRGDIR